MPKQDYGFRLVGKTNFRNVREFTHPSYGTCFTATSNTGKKKYSVTKPTALQAAKALDLYLIKSGFKQVNNLFKEKV